MMKRYRSISDALFPLLRSLSGPAVLVAVWFSVASLHGSVPGPVETARAAWGLAAHDLLAQATWASVSRVLVGFAAGSTLGITLGVLTGLNAALRISLGAAIELLRPIPPIAWIPLAIALFGIGNPPAIFVIFLGAFFPVFTNTFAGVASVRSSHLEAASLLGATRLAAFRHVVWPSSLPQIFSGLAIGLGVAWMCVVAAEMVAARSGLGYQIQVDRQLLRLDRVAAAMAAIGILGFFFSRLLRGVQHLSMPWVYGQLLPWHRRWTLAAAEGASLAPASTPPPEPTGLRIDNLAFAYEPDEPVLDQISLTVAPAEFISILGPSGCGKTTLLRLVSGLETPSSGNAAFVPLDERASSNSVRVSMVFQDLALFDWMTAAGNIAFPLHMRALPRPQLLTRVRDLLELTDLGSRADAFPSQLSGGQAQRVALARSLAARPQILLMDEPFSGLDGPTRDRLQEETRSLLARWSMTVIMVTHDVREALFMSDRVLVLDKRGRMASEIQVPAENNRGPQFRHTPEFIGLEDQIREAVQW